MIITDDTVLSSCHAAGNGSYLSDAQNFYTLHLSSESDLDSELLTDWNNVYWASNLLLANLTGTAAYHDAIKVRCDLLPELHNTFSVIIVSLSCCKAGIGSSQRSDWTLLLDEAVSISGFGAATLSASCSQSFKPSRERGKGTKTHIERCAR